MAPTIIDSRTMVEAARRILIAADRPMTTYQVWSAMCNQLGCTAWDCTVWHARQALHYLSLQAECAREIRHDTWEAL